ncbi:hypothetical protein [Fusibacter ferrireducens]|nr:hypothetical protein [Fusibacter ferrireducens]
MIYKFRRGKGKVMDQEYIIAHADKSVMKISGLRVKGLNTKKLEQILMEKLHTVVRVIGVTGESIEMDAYDIEPDQVRKNEKGLIEILALTEGITATEVAQISCSEKIVEVIYDQIPEKPISACAKERWIKRS